ncbi:MAG: hypothetical protein Q7S21_03450 [archaeon]|nr:hypothetical protein [archaeon]
MTTQNNILLIVKQNRGIDYNALLTKISPNYASINSARAALSRAMKDAVAFGLVIKQKNAFFLTQKGELSLSTELKNELLIKLNKTINVKDPVSEIDSIVKQLHTLIERSKQDTDLVKAARGSTDFFISDLNEINRNLTERSKHLDYLINVFGSQIDTLKGMNFNDSQTFSLNEENFNQLLKISEKTDFQQLIIETNDTIFLESLAEKHSIKTKSGSLFLPSNKLLDCLQEIKKYFLTDVTKNIRLNLGSIKLYISFPRLTIIGSFNEVKELVEFLDLKK